ncbi:hypothetical protein [Herbaspirillum huttiense]|uniref:hypothetical protein n=1 Tax=Herbaspirillum huttiense TaxID=863372 RepID=UPI000585C0A2|nr:hypothetical protein [Herbaspirillum huttiense]
MQVHEDVKSASRETAVILSRVEQVLQIAQEIRIALKSQNINAHNDLISRAHIVASSELTGLATMESVLGNVRIISSLELNKDIQVPSVRMVFYHDDCHDEGVFVLEFDFLRNVLANAGAIGFQTVPEAEEKEDLANFVYFLKAAVLAEIMKKMG